MQCKMFSFPLAFCLPWNNHQRKTHFWKTSLSLHPQNIIRTKLTISGCWELVDTQINRRCSQSFMNFSLYNSLGLEGLLWNWCSRHLRANIKILAEVFGLWSFCYCQNCIYCICIEWCAGGKKQNGIQEKGEKNNKTNWIMGSTRGIC